MFVTEASLENLEGAPHQGFRLGEPIGGPQQLRQVVEVSGDVRAGHAFMGPHNALGTLNTALAARIWPEVVSFLQETVR